MKKILFLIISVSTALYVNAQEADSLFQKGNELYANARYQDAIEIYENLMSLGYESPELFLNTGNSYYKQNIIARAILNYEKALLLEPNNNDIKYNLELANRLVIDKIEVLPVFFIKGWIRSVRNLFSSDIWAIISLSAFAIALIFISIFLYSRNFGLKKISFWLGFFIVLLSAISFIFSNQQKQRILSGNTAIVMNPSVTVKSSPDTSGTDLFVIHEGTKVSIADQISDWKEIKLSDGSKGWLKTEDLEVI